MHVRRLVALAATLLLLGFRLPAGHAGQTGLAGTDEQIAASIRAGSQLMPNLEYLCDQIGPRVTGSAGLLRANEWVAGRLKEYGLQNVRQEPWTISRGWERGTCTLEMVAPRAQALRAASVAWGASTRGPITGPVVYLSSTLSMEDLKAHAGKLRGAIVLSARPPGVNGHPSRAPDARRPLRGTAEVEATDAQRRGAAEREEFLAKEGAAATLTDAGKPMLLLTMSGSWLGNEPKIPRLFVAHEHYAMLWRLLQRGVQVRAKVDVRNRIARGPITVYNTVGEIPGTEKPEEMVIVGGHLDSWDLAPGTVDNGTGCMTVLEAARVLQALGVKPRRTIRFVFFAGEEEGLVGSREYVKLHKDELARVSGVFVLDTGTGRITGVGLHGNGQVQPVFESEMPALKALGVERYSAFRMGGTDHAPFADAGVPAFWMMQDSADYNWYHHTEADTFDKALPEDLEQCATVTAICALGVANRTDMLPRRPAPAAN